MTAAGRCDRRLGLAGSFFSIADESMGLANIPTKGLLGGIIALGITVTILVAVPAARWFLALSIPAGLIVAGILHLSHRRNI